jgi:D-amino-acid dehydrogenase
VKVVVVGAGIIGLATARALAKRGCEVLVVGDRPPGAGASVNNAGWIVPAESGPVPAPGVVLQTLRWMLRPDSPVHVRPIPSPSFARFLFGMFRACNARAYAAAFEATVQLARGTMAELDGWVADGLSFEMHDEGELRAYVDVEELRRATADLARHERAGFKPVVLGGAEARSAVPALSERVVGAIRFPGQRHVRPATLVTALAERLRMLHVELIEGRVTTGRVLASGGVEVGGAFGSIVADAAVIAAGAWSGRVARIFGAGLPVWPGKGYSVDYVPSPLPTLVPLLLSEAHCVLTPLDGALRLAGTMEFGGLDEHISGTRVAALRRAPTRYLSRWDPEGPSLAPTAGLRPMAPDGLPIIGRLSSAPSIVVATAHAMLGLTLAPRTAALLADVLLDGADPQALRPFSPRRFGA